MSEATLPDENDFISPSEPQPVSIDEKWEHVDLFRNVYKALFALPSFFKSELMVSGVLATDLFTFNASLGATIEAQVADALNILRSTWDPEQKYNLYHFVRQPQTFPDVTLRASAPNIDPPILMGIELKGWYILAKEKEPSFRYKVTPNVCAPADLLVVYPWALSYVISGSPRLFQPYVIGARYAAEYRNWYWQYKKSGSSNNSIRLSTVSRYYPDKSAPISDDAVIDKGGNFGRFARTRLMDAYIARLVREELSGIPLSAWQGFLAIFSEGWSDDKVARILDLLAIEYSMRRTGLSQETLVQIQMRLQEIGELLVSR